MPTSRTGLVQRALFVQGTHLKGRWRFLLSGSSRARTLSTFFFFALSSPSSHQHFPSHVSTALCQRDETRRSWLSLTRRLNKGTLSHSQKRLLSGFVSLLLSGCRAWGGVHAWHRRGGRGSGTSRRRAVETRFRRVAFVRSRSEGCCHETGLRKMLRKPRGVDNGCRCF